jgi:hypothetical protein
MYIKQFRAEYQKISRVWTDVDAITSLILRMVLGMNAKADKREIVLRAEYLWGNAKTNDDYGWVGEARRKNEYEKNLLLKGWISARRRYVISFRANVNGLSNDKWPKRRLLWKLVPLSFGRSLAVWCVPRSTKHYLHHREIQHLFRV